MATADWDCYAFPGRFKTARRKKRLLKAHRDKNLILLFKEWREIIRKQYALGYVDVIPPVQKGWKRFFVLREDVARGKDAAFFLELLEKINTVQYSHRKDFKRKKRFRGKKVDVTREQYVRSFWKWEFKKQKFTEKELAFFREEWRPDHRGHLIAVYVFTESWRFVLKTKPNMITKRQIIDPQLMGRRQEIDNYLDGRMLTPRAIKLLVGNYYRRDRWCPLPKPKYRQIIKTNPLDEIKY